jgi:hypothetical protein
MTSRGNTSPLSRGRPLGGAQESISSSTLFGFFAAGAEGGDPPRTPPPPLLRGVGPCHLGPRSRAPKLGFGAKSGQKVVKIRGRSELWRSRHLAYAPDSQPLVRDPKKSFHRPTLFLTENRDSPECGAASGAPQAPGTKVAVNPVKSRFFGTGFFLDWVSPPTSGGSG